MSKTMVDGTHANVNAIRDAAINYDIVAGYDTGTPDIKWTPEDWNLFPGIPHVHIDQGYGDTRSAEAHAIAFDVESSAFQPGQAEALINANMTARPTIYVDRFNLAATIASAMKSSKWKGDIWLAYPGWTSGIDLPSIPPTCRYVAVQSVFGRILDLSIVLDNTWPNPASPVNWTEELVKDLPAIGKNATGPFVRRIQGLCVAEGLNVGIDGSFGPATQNAVMAVQRKAGITVDGIVGQQTWPALLGV